MDLNIKGLRVIVTAGANGIGLAIARAFAGEGARVHVCDVDQAALAALTASDPTITQTHCDVADRASVQRLFDEATANSAASTSSSTTPASQARPPRSRRCIPMTGIAA